MQEILRRYLSFTRRLQEMSPVLIELGPFVSDTLLVLSAWATEARVQLISYGDASIEADPRGLREALLNLVANGIEATPPGGAVVVEVRASGDGAEIVVRDTAVGCPPRRWHASARRSSPRERTALGSAWRSRAR